MLAKVGGSRLDAIASTSCRCRAMPSLKAGQEVLVLDLVERRHAERRRPLGEEAGSPAAPSRPAAPRRRRAERREEGRGKARVASGPPHRTLGSALRPSGPQAGHCMANPPGGDDPPSLAQRRRQLGEKRIQSRREVGFDEAAVLGKPGVDPVGGRLVRFALERPSERHEPFR